MSDVIVLDLDGPVLDTRGRHAACYALVGRELGLDLEPFDRQWSAKRSGRPGAGRVAEAHGLDVARAFSRRWIAHIEDPELLALDRLQPEVSEVIDDWRAGGLRLVLCTLRQDRQALGDQLDALGLSARLDDVLVATHRDGAEGKADAVARLPGGVPLWFIGDTEIDIAAARLLDCPSWALSCGVRSAEFLRSQHPDRLSGYLYEVDLRVAA